MTLDPRIADPLTVEEELPEPVSFGYLDVSERPSLTIPLVLLCAVVGAVFVALWWFRG